VALNTLNHNYGQPLVVSSLNVTGNTVLDGSLTLLGAFSLVGNSSLALSTPLAVTSGGTGLSATTKGGILVGTSTSAFTNLTVGTDGYLLTVDSTQPSGVKWAAAPVSLPTQTGNAGSFLTTNGSTASWAAISQGTVTSIATSTGLTGGTITTTGTLAIDTTVVPQLGVANTFTAQQTIAPTSTTVVPLTVNAPTSTTVDVLDVNINGTKYLWVDKYGNTFQGSGTIGTATALGARLGVYTNGPSVVGLIVKGAPSQTSDLVQYQNSAVTTLGGVNAAGQRYIGATPANGSSIFSHTSASASSTTVATFTLNTVSTANPVVVGGSVTTTGFTPSYFNGTFPVNSTGGSSGAWTYTVYNAAATFTASGTSTVQGTAKVSGTLTVQGSTIYSVPIVVQSLSSQATNLQEWQNSSGTALAYITSAGGMTLNSQLITPSIVYASQFSSNSYSSQLTNVRWNAAVNNTNSTGGMVLAGGYNSNAVAVIIKATGGSQATTGISTATANGTTSVTYTTGYSGQLVPGSVVTITGIVSTGNSGATAGTGFNLTAATVTAASTTQFTATAPSALTDTYTSGGYVTSVSGIADITQWQTAQGTTLAKVDYQGNLTATKFVTTSGTSSQFVKGDGSLDSGTYLNSSNYNTYAPSLTGTSASGTWNISISGNAATATTATSATTAGSVTNGLTTSNYSSYALPLSGGTLTGFVIGKVNTGGTIIGSNDTGSFSIRGDGSNSCAISFHRPGIFATNMGLDTDNVFKIGGWSAGIMISLTGSNCTLPGSLTINSDAKLKENLVLISNPLDKVHALNGYNYNRIGSDKLEMGVVAQEVQRVLPELIHEDSEGILSVAYQNMVALLIEAVKEQSAKITALEEQVKELKG